MIAGTVVCDTDGCGWQIESCNVTAWMDKKCPQCANPLMDEVDKRVLSITQGLIDEGLATQEKSDKTVSVIIHVDSAKFTRSA